MHAHTLYIHTYVCIYKQILSVVWHLWQSILLKHYNIQSDLDQNTVLYSALENSWEGMTNSSVSLPCCHPLRHAVKASDL